MTAKTVIQNWIKRRDLFSAVKAPNRKIRAQIAETWPREFESPMAPLK
jgi:hypothetical protein